MYTYTQPKCLFVEKLPKCNDVQTKHFHAHLAIYYCFPLGLGSYDVFNYNLGLLNARRPVLVSSFPRVFDGVLFIQYNHVDGIVPAGQQLKPFTILCSFWTGVQIAGLICCSSCNYKPRATASNLSGTLRLRWNFNRLDFRCIFTVSRLSRAEGIDNVPPVRTSDSKRTSGQLFPCMSVNIGRQPSMV